MAKPVSFAEPERLTEIFDASHREEWQNTSHILRTLNLPDNAIIADVGAGTGYFSTLFAQLAPKGLVYAIDAEPNMVDWLHRRIARENINNIIIRQCSQTDPELPKALDVVFMANTYRFIQNRTEYLNNLYSQITHQTKVILVDYRGNNARVTPLMTMNEVQSAGFHIDALDTEGCPDHYIMTLRKPLTSLRK